MAGENERPDQTGDAWELRIVRWLAISVAVAFLALWLSPTLRWVFAAVSFD